MKKLLALALFFISCALHAEILTTPTYEIAVGACPEGYVSCSAVDFVVTNLATGATSTYQGKTRHSLCKDGVTPCQFLGYQFSGKDRKFTLSVNGSLEINYTDGKDCVFEQGQWSY